MRRHHILIPLAALLAVFPLLVHGCSCGHDFDFHLQSWLDVAYQLRHGTYYPHWIISAAWNAGEPRFLFYPPLSWLLGAILTLYIPINLVPIVYTFLALTAAGFAMHHLARHFTTPNAALLASVLYLANPYMLFNAFERTAYAELLAAAWIPLLFLAILRVRPTIRGIAIPIALLWLTNAPAAVMGCYTFAVIAAYRLYKNVRHPKQSLSPATINRATIGSATINPDTISPGTIRYPDALASGLIDAHEGGGFSPWGMLSTILAGTALGLTLPAFYLIPAAYERRYVQIAMAIIPNMRFQDNFLFGHTADIAHNIVLHTASLLAVTLLTFTAATLLMLFLTRNKPVILSEVRSTQSKDPDTSNTATSANPFLTTNLYTPLASLTLLIAFLLTPLSAPLWQHLPNLAFLQFPWRLLTILAPILTLSVALLVDHLKPSGAGAPFIAWLHRAMSGKPLLLAAPTIVLALTFLAFHLYHQPCDPADTPTAVAASFHTHHGVAPTDEYTPLNADNDILRPNNPAYWFSTDPTAFAPNTAPNPGSTDPNFDGTFPPAQTLSVPTPLHLTPNLPQPETLILNLRDYPNWLLTRNGTPIATHIQRDDGLLAVALPAGPSVIDITWQLSRDQQLGLAITACALLALTLTFRRSRKIVSE